MGSLSRTGIRGAIPGSTNGFLVVRHTELDETKLPPRVEDDNNQETETSLIEVSAPEAPAAEAEETPVAEAEEEKP